MRFRLTGFVMVGEKEAAAMTGSANSYDDAVAQARFWMLESGGHRVTLRDTRTHQVHVMGSDLAVSATEPATQLALFDGA